jgi:hypothetical protein
MTVTREVRNDDWCVRLDLDPQVLRLEVPQDVVSFDPGGTEDSPLSPTLPRSDSGPVSAATLLLKAKQFDDGLYAAVELAAQPNKAALLTSLAEALASAPGPDPAAAALVFGACDLGGLPARPPARVEPAVRAAVEAFLGEGRLSKPLGFYTWTPQLEAVFRQDRLLQQPLDAGPAEALCHALAQTTGGWAAYDDCLRLAARLSNPPQGESLRGRGDQRTFSPAARSHEGRLLEQLYGDRPIPQGFDLMAELVRRVRSDQVSLQPTEASGWYDYQAWSLEPLVVPDRIPESARLELGPRYREHLEALFRGTLAQARETHVKQLDFTAVGRPAVLPFYVRPDLTVEPLPSLYARRADGYRYVRTVLGEAFGEGALGRMHRLTPEGPAAPSLAEELAGMEGLFSGASATACRELGRDPFYGDGESAGRFSSWRAGLRADPDVSRDARLMTPVYYDVQRRKTKVWALLGWRRVPVEVDFKKKPRVLAVEPAKPPESEATDRLSVLRSKFRKVPEKPQATPPVVKFRGDRYQLAVPEMAEVYVEQLLDRDEFRRHCDRLKTRPAILANLR